ncbi:hypothetical protein EI71_00134 [Anaeroplasma bactoclasticum]|jgi:hypothetical protein|uniref:Uncharacterized protein n=1 Tax=Anaeroplasma bactoclasticum TaxID=2088 RepID=A0A397RWN4_9MOLU|nr:hypothetical protein [Anaeroplasma bactoclasticum]RIA78573.1 hypothetical protein EI71_00134 [Anaeroplasma bactoclasticum]
MKYVYSEEYVLMRLKKLKEKSHDEINTTSFDLNYLVELCNKYNLSLDFFVIVEK